MVTDQLTRLTSGEEMCRGKERRNEKMKCLGSGATLVVQMYMNYN